ncbi:unnamed protein product [Amoebophrya sp. A120]|nr:unnamed protein product [Amoebophrya sp. A120]|eukprot:GSA120T00023578001.1
MPTSSVHKLLGGTAACPLLSCFLAFAAAIAYHARAQTIAGGISPVLPVLREQDADTLEALHQVAAYEATPAAERSDSTSWSSQLNQNHAESESVGADREKEEEHEDVTAPSGPGDAATAKAELVVRRSAVAADSNTRTSPSVVDDHALEVLPSFQRVYWPPAPAAAPSSSPQMSNNSPLGSLHLDLNALAHRILKADLSLPWVEQLWKGHEASYPTLEEGMKLLTEWEKAYPDCFVKEKIGESFQGRELLAYKLACSSTRPKAAGAAAASTTSPAAAVLPLTPIDNRPKFLLTSLTHSREPAGLVVVLFFVGQLLARRGIDPDADFVLQERLIYVIPFVNPDGYVFNEKSRTKMKRKNMRPTCNHRVEDGGVDLNRNFPTHWKRVPSGCSEEYGGTKPFSEPETAALEQLVKKVKFTVCSNLHAFGSMLTHPYNYKTRNTLPPDDALIYKEINKVFKYSKFGTAKETVGYTAFGESDDWFYDQGIISMSPEVGHEEDGFWPRQGKIRGIIERNYIRMRYLALKTGCEIYVELGVSSGNRNVATVSNKGLATCTNPTIALKIENVKQAPAAQAVFDEAAGSGGGLSVGATFEQTPDVTVDQAFVAEKSGLVVFTVKKDLPRRTSVQVHFTAGGAGFPELTPPGGGVVVLSWCSQSGSAPAAAEQCQCRQNEVKNNKETEFQSPNFPLCTVTAVKRAASQQTTTPLAGSFSAEAKQMLGKLTTPAKVVAKQQGGGGTTPAAGNGAASTAAPAGSSANKPQTPVAPSSPGAGGAGAASPVPTPASPTPAPSKNPAAAASNASHPPGRSKGIVTGFFSFAGERLSDDLLQTVGLLAVLSLTLLACNVYVLARKYLFPQISSNSLSFHPAGGLIGTAAGASSARHVKLTEQDESAFTNSSGSKGIVGGGIGSSLEDEPTFVIDVPAAGKSEEDLNQEGITAPAAAGRGRNSPVRNVSPQKTSRVTGGVGLSPPRAAAQE